MSGKNKRNADQNGEQLLNDQPMSDQIEGATDAAQPSADQDQPVSSDVPPADAASDQTISIDMEDFITRADRASWLSVADAAKYLTDVRGATDIDAQKMRNAANNRKEFAADGATLKVRVPGYDIKPLTYLHQSAVDLYHDNNASGNTRSGRVLTNGKRWIVRVKADDHAAVVDALAAFGITLETASAAHKKATAEDAAIGAVLEGVAQHSEAAEDETAAANLAQADDASSNGAEHTDDGAPVVDMQRTEEMSFA